MSAAAKAHSNSEPKIDWQRVAETLYISRCLDDIEERRLVPEKKVLYQFSARGHDMAQIILGQHLTHPHDGIGAYYRSRPLLLSIGLSVEDASSGPLMRCGGFSDGRDIGVVCNIPRSGSGDGLGDGPVVLPMSGDVGSQFTPIAGWAQSIVYRREVLKDSGYRGAIGVVLGGDASVATSGFWSALTIATTLKLPLLFYIEDNGFGISVPSHFQTPGGNIRENLASFKNLSLDQGDGSNPLEASTKIAAAVNHVRSGVGPALLRLTVPRLSGHSGQDTQAYKSPDLVASEQARDPLLHLKRFMVPSQLSEVQWIDLESRATQIASAGVERALARAEPDVTSAYRYRYAEYNAKGEAIPALRGGVAAEGLAHPTGTTELLPEAQRSNMLTCIRRTLEHELKINPRVVVFGEDVGPKGGVHAATLGLQEQFGEQRVFDTSLSEEGIIGRAVGMAIAGLVPVAEIQFRKYADPATEQLNNCGTMRWRTANRFAAPIIVRMPGGFAKCGDPWHSVSGEVLWAHAIGWQVAIPSNAEDAVGLLRSALRSDNPTIFFEHRHMLDATWARRPYPGDDYIIPFGKAKQVLSGDRITVVSWGAMVERCELAAKQSGLSVELLDLRTIAPWDRDLVLQSVSRTRRALVVHEDGQTAGFGAEVCAYLAEHAFLKLDAPLSRLAVQDIPIPHNVAMMEHILPSVEQIAAKIVELVEF